MKREAALTHRDINTSAQPNKQNNWYTLIHVHMTSTCTDSMTHSRTIALMAFDCLLFIQMVEASCRQKYIFTIQRQ